MANHSPWLSIWIHPRETIARIVADDPNRALWWLAGIYGFSSLMNMFQSMMLGGSLGTASLFILAIIVAPFWGWLNFSVWSCFVAWVGKWFKGRGSFTTVRSAYAWSCVPLILNIPLWLLLVVTFGHQLFLNFPNAHLLPQSQVMFLFGVLGVKIILFVWSFIIYLNALAEVQKFSILKACFNVAIAGVISVVILGIIISVLWSLLFYISNLF